MSSSSSRIQLPFIEPAQAQKHVTHNEALARLDVLVQLTVQNIDEITPPTAPVDGEIWALGTSATGDWAGQDNMLAAYVTGGWVFIEPQVGWIATNASDQTLLTLTDTGWSRVGQADLDNLVGVGVNTSSDAENRLAVSSPSTLLSHEGAGHQLKINKSTVTDTASLLYQTNWSGRAEMGTTGDDNFAIKVSADGTNWTTALTLDAATGIATGQAVQQSATDVTTGRLARADYSYGPGNVVGTVSETAGIPTGAVIESGENTDGSYVRYADGTQICTHTGLFASYIKDHYCAVNWSFPADFISPPTGTQVIVDGSVWNDLDPRPTVDRGDIVPVRGNYSETALSAQTWARSGISFDISDLIPLSVMSIGRWY